MITNDKFELALALYLIGMEVANTDKDIDERETAALILCARNAMDLCSSDYVRDIAEILAKYGHPNSRPNPLEEYYESDNRGHEEIINSVAKKLKKVPISDRMRYLDTAWGIFEGVAKASGGSSYGLANVSDAEAAMGGGVWLMLSDGLHPNEMKDWIQKHGY